MVRLTCALPAYCPPLYCAVLRCTALLSPQYRQLDGSTFTFMRNALIQRMVDISSRFSEGDIAAVLESHGLQDRGQSALEGIHIGLQVGVWGLGGVRVLGFFQG